MPSNPYAFPVPFIRDQNGQFEAANHFDMGGMELRDYFAGQALVGLLAQQSNVNALKAILEGANQDLFASVSRIAYAYADAMRVEREKEAEDA